MINERIVGSYLDGWDRLIRLGPSSLICTVWRLLSKHPVVGRTVSADIFCVRRSLQGNHNGCGEI
jgi:hypothetical protein